MLDPRTLKIMVAGGSIGGLATGIALTGIGCEVKIFERKREPLQSAGAGIVVQPDLLGLLARAKAPPLPMTRCRQRCHLAPDGRETHVALAHQQFTSWESIYWTMRGVFPDANYHLGAEVTNHRQTGDGVAFEIERHGTVQADLLVAADGMQSGFRRMLQPQAQPSYAGYIAWRGTVPESAVSDALLAKFDDRFTFCEARSGGHMLVYLIPGEGADARYGHRCLNWVWYVAADDQALEDHLTDRHGRRHHSSLPRGYASDAAIDYLRTRAREELAPVMAKLVAATDEPFIQKIADAAVERTVFDRVMLLGDAAFLVRPHTAAAAAKACFDASLLAEALSHRETSSLEAALATVEPSQLDYGRRLVEHGVTLGRNWPARRRRAAD